MDELHIKLKKLKEILEEMGKVAVAFSYGVDSTFLLKAAHEVLGSNVLAITARSLVLPESESEGGIKFCKEEGIEQLIIDYDILEDEAVTANTKLRCYYCKKRLMSTFKSEAESKGFAILIDGSNLDDDNDYRPGSKALQELGIRSPLKEAGLTKQDIRLLSKEMGLPTWDKPSMACLATRIPYDEELTEEKLLKIGKSEAVLKSLGFGQLRVRLMGDSARIELDRSEFSRIIDKDLSDKIYDEFKAIGFVNTTLDIKAYGEER